MTKTTTAKSLHAKAIATVFSLTLGLSGVASMLTPTTAYANDGLNPRDSITYTQTATQNTQTTTQKAAHYEGQKVTIGEDWGQPVWAEWHRGDSGKWWAMFWTYNNTKVYAEPAAAGCGWSFHAYDKDGNFVTIYRCEESSTHGLYGSQGVSSHWTNADGSMWF